MATTRVTLSATAWTLLADRPPGAVIQLKTGFEAHIVVATSLPAPETVGGHTLVDGRIPLRLDDLATGEAIYGRGAVAGVEVDVTPIGAAGGFTVVVRPAISVQATPDYSDGDCVGGLVTLSGFARVAAGSGLLNRIALRTKLSGGIGVQMFLHLFDANPSASTFTDNGAMSIHADDRAKILKTIVIAAADWVSPKGASPWYTAELLKPSTSDDIDFIQYQLASGRDLYLALEADGTINFAATDDLAALVAAENN